MKKKEKRLLLWGIGGLAALYLLTRQKKTATKQAQTHYTSTAIPDRRSTATMARVGLPYTYSADI